MWLSLSPISPTRALNALRGRATPYADPLRRRVAKRIDLKYQHGPSKRWLKVKEHPLFCALRTQSNGKGGGTCAGTS